MPTIRTLGYSGIQVTDLGFGAWGIGGTAYGPTDDDVSRQALRTAFEYGIRFYDTADVYGTGHSERLIAQALGPFREALTIASKVGFNFYDGSSAPTFDRDYILGCCDKSLARLETHAIDVYQLHNPPPEVLERGEALEALLDLEQAGKIRKPAVSVRTAEDAALVLAIPEFRAIQVIYNCIDQRPRALGLLEEARLKGVGIIARVPLAYGFLSGRYQPGHDFGPKDHRARRSTEEIAQYLHRAAQFERYLQEGRVSSMIELALRFCLSDPAVSTVIPGLKTPAQVRQAVQAVDRGPLGQDMLDVIYDAGRAWAEADSHLALAGR